MKPSQSILMTAMLSVSVSVSAITLDPNTPAECTSNPFTIVTCAPAANVGPTADINGPFADFVNANITFDGSGSFDTDGTITNYNWNFGDGHFGSGAITTHAFEAAGLYTVSLNVIDNDGANAMAFSSANITAVPSPVPVPAAIWLFASGLIGLVGVSRRKT